MSAVRPHTPLLTALRGQLQHTRQSYSAHRALERELATRTSESDLNELHAILDRYSDRETVQIRRMLARRPA